MKIHCRGFTLIELLVVIAILSVVVGLLLGLVAYAFRVQNYDRWMLLLVLGTFTGAYPLMYFAQEFVPLPAAMVGSAAVVLTVVSLRCATLMGWRVGLWGAALPATIILVVTLVAALHPRLQGLLITLAGLTLFVTAMQLVPRLKPVNPSSLTSATRPAGA